MSTGRSIITHHRSHRARIITLIRHDSPSPSRLSRPRSRSWTAVRLPLLFAERTERMANRGESRRPLSNDDTLSIERQREGVHPLFRPLFTNRTRKVADLGGVRNNPCRVSHPFGRQIPSPGSRCVAGFPIYLEDGDDVAIPSPNPPPSFLSDALPWCALVFVAVNTRPAGQSASQPPSQPASQPHGHTAPLHGQPHTPRTHGRTWKG